MTGLQGCRGYFRRPRHKARGGGIVRSLRFQHLGSIQPEAEQSDEMLVGGAGKFMMGVPPNH